jgi:hypothetical protein
MAVAVVLMVTLVGSLAIAGPSTTASTAAHGQYGKTPVCHATGNAKNPYAFLKVPQNSAHFAKHPADLFGPAIAGKDDCPDGDVEPAKAKDNKGKASKAKANKAKDNKGKASKAKANKVSLPQMSGRFSLTPPLAPPL